MKISKLFHWLYAILMFLPILVFIPNAFYYGFNETAVAQEKTEQVPVYYESNVVNDYNDLYYGKIYHFLGENSYTTPLSLSVNVFKIKKTDNLRPIINNFNDVTSIYFYLTTNSNTWLNIYYNDLPNSYINISNKPFDFVYDNNLNSQYIDNVISYINESTYLLSTGDTTPVTTNMSITDSMSYAWESTWQNDLFSWSYGSFLTQPFLYITNLFNVPATNTLLYCLSYWLNISIIWLCFDVVMYVPLLVHRWLDKGIVE